MPENILASLSAKKLRKAAALRHRIDVLTRQLQNILGSGASPAAAPARPARKRRRSMSAAARAKIAAAQRKVWAKRKGKK